MYRSGQTGQTVNLMALPSKVRILPRPILMMLFGGIVCEHIWGSKRIDKRIIFGNGFCDERIRWLEYANAVPPRGHMAVLVTLGAALRWGSEVANTIRGGPCLRFQIETSTRSFGAFGLISNGWTLRIVVGLGHEGVDGVALGKRPKVTICDFRSDELPADKFEHEIRRKFIAHELEMPTWNLKPSDRRGIKFRLFSWRSWRLERSGRL